MARTKGQRLQEFTNRLGALPLKATLNAVEDELTSIPFNPETVWEQ